MSSPSAVTLLEQRLNADWPNLRTAREQATAKRKELTAALAEVDSEDVSVVVSGSLARDEFTSGSDIDWTLLIDGVADPEHHNLTKKVRSIVSRLSGKDPGPEGTFGDMVFSHDLVHQIGGQDDTNRNTTRRLLLLLESRAIGREDAYRRVVRAILTRYLSEDRGFWTGSQFRVPRFLQNDFARYWRTLAVDFAFKLRERAGRGWAIRNIKLRISRKLIYVSGLLACFRCHLDFVGPQSGELFRPPLGQSEVIERVESFFRLTPLEILCDVLLRYPHLDETARRILTSYDGFVGILADPVKRNHLENIPADDDITDPLFQQARQLSHTFRDGLLEFFFDQQSPMAELTKNYGVF